MSSLLPIVIGSVVVVGLVMLVWGIVSIARILRVKER